ncbi:hypothetical protein [Flagellimonas oceanensis]|uniref:hypothetical protein n=1 Tax=Flagellimonas oceanensis TaxID=2499163 RepID=UPI000F8DC4E1|nr:hypothetical protein [Allomuricauda oceanensis]
MYTEWQDKYYNEIEQRIVESAIYSYEENLRLSYQRTDFKSRLIEYLIVVNIAKKLFDWGWDNFIHVQLEYPIYDYYNGAFPEFSWDKKLKRQNHNPPKNKSGRIDIALTKEPYRSFLYRKPKHMSLVGIEIKSFVRNNSIVEKDIVRLSEAMVQTDDIEKNSIRAGYVLFFKKLDRPNQIVKDSEIPEMKYNELSKWEMILDCFKNKNQSLEYMINPIEVKEAALAELEKKYDPDFTSHDEVAENSGLIMCYLVKIKRKSK